MIQKAAIFLVIVSIVLAVASCSKDETTSPKETIPPNVSIISPQDGATREGTVEFKINASDTKGIKEVQLFSNGKLIGTDKDEPYVIDWDMSAVANGVITKVYARAIDKSGNSKNSAEINITKGHTNPPVATLLGPAEGTSAKQGSLITFSASATDAEEGDLPDADFTWSSDLQGTLKQGKTIGYRGLCEGQHTITLTVTDRDGLTDTKEVTVIITDNGQDYAYVSEGSYIIGPPLYPARTVYFNRPFIISKTELSIGEFLTYYDAKLLPNIAKRNTKFYGLYPADILTNTYADYPMIFTTLYEFVEYCQTISKRDNLIAAYEFLDKNNVVALPTKVSSYVKARLVSGATGWRLPTEAEWEVAANGGNAKYAFPWGSEPASGRCNSRSDPYPPNMVILALDRGVAPVKSYELFRNKFGLYNVSGNVAEICSDIYINEELPAGFDPVGYTEDSSVSYVVKGGSWYQSGEEVVIPMRATQIPFSSDTTSLNPKNKWDSGIGVRLVRNLPEPGAAPPWGE